MEGNSPTTVRFRLADVVHPHPQQVLEELFKNLGLEGEVAADTSDGEVSYFLVRVHGLADPVIVPQSKAQPVDSAGPAPALRTAASVPSTSANSP
jgi:hypothetical protein